MDNNLIISNIASWLFGVLVFIIGLLNLFLVHPVPGIAYLLLSFVYFLPAHSLVNGGINPTLVTVAKIMLGVVLLLFTLGVSDLGDMIDKW